jgi:hypothetical protein
VHRMRTKMRPLWQRHLGMQRIRRLYWRICESQWFRAGGLVGWWASCGYVILYPRGAGFVSPPLSVDYAL